MAWLGFLIGLWVGALLGILAVAICRAGHEFDESAGEELQTGAVKR